MKIMVFGGAGFLGSHVADCLSDNGHEVVIFDLMPSPYIRPEQGMVVGDILDKEAVKKAAKGIDAVYHFAGMADISLAKQDPYKTIQTNIIGTTNILEACCSNNVKRFTFASSIYVYGEEGSFYRASKQACELIIECYHKQNNIDFTILRYGSLYGPRANETNWIYSVLKQALNEKKITRRGDGEELREYIHVSDAARLTVKTLGDEFKNQYVMITGQQPTRIRDLLIMIKEMLNNEIKLEFTREDDDAGHYEITPYLFKPKLAKRLVNSSYVDLGQGLLELINTIYDRQVHRKQTA